MVGPAVKPTTAPATRPTGPNTSPPDNAPSAASPMRSSARAGDASASVMVSAAMRGFMMRPPEGATDHEAKWGGSAESAWPRRGGLEFRFEVLLEDRHLDREITSGFLGEHETDELVAPVQVGTVALCRSLPHDELLPEVLLEIDIELRYRLVVELGGLAVSE